MDLIYTDKHRQDVNVFKTYTLDLAFGSDENNFSLKIPSSDHCCEAGSLIYAENTEYGGIVDSVEIDTGAKEITYHGRTWQGIIGDRIILPLQASEPSYSGVTITRSDSSGSLVNKYLKISGDIHSCIGFLLARSKLSVEYGGIFDVVQSASGVFISNFQFDRYTDVYSGIVRMLRSVGCKLKLSYEDGICRLSSALIIDYSETDEFDSDLVQFKSRKDYNKINHLICLGSGELEHRMVIHLYADNAGNISQTCPYEPSEEAAAIYDYPNAESYDDLYTSGIERLGELRNTDEISITFNGDSEEFDIGDIVSAIDQITGFSCTAKISKKIITIKNGVTDVSYSVGV